MRASTTIALAAAFAAALVVLVGCSGVALPGAMAGPVIVEGVFLYPTGAPVPDAEVTLSVSDWAGAVDPGDEAVNFDLTGLVPGTGQGGFWSFPRGIDGSAWVGDAPTVELRVLAP